MPTGYRSIIATSTDDAHSVISAAFAHRASKNAATGTTRDFATARTCSAWSPRSMLTTVSSRRGTARTSPSANVPDDDDDDDKADTGSVCPARVTVPDMPWLK